MWDCFGILVSQKFLKRAVAVSVRVSIRPLPNGLPYISDAKHDDIEINSQIHLKIQNETKIIVSIDK